MANKLIDISMLDPNLVGMITSATTMYPVPYSLITSNTNPDNYNFAKVIDTTHKNEIYKWDTTLSQWTLLGIDDNATNWAAVANKPNTVSGYGITDVYTQAQSDAIIGLLNTLLTTDKSTIVAAINEIASRTTSWSSITGKPNTISGYGITDAYTKSEVDFKNSFKVDLAEYSIHNHDGRYYKNVEIDALVGNLGNLLTTDQSNVVNAINEIKLNGGGGGGGDMPLLVVEDEWEGSSNITKSFTNSCMGLSVVNEGTTPVIVTIGNKTIQIDAGESFDNLFKPFKTLTVTASGQYKALVTTPYSLVVAPDTTPPNNVTNLTAANIGGTSLTLSWNASTSLDVDSYDVYNGSTLLATITGTAYTVTGLSVSTNYTFTVKVRDVNNNVSSGSSVNATTTSVLDTTAPNDVTSLNSSNITLSSVTLTWVASNSSDIASYEIYRGSTFVTSVAHPTTTYNVTGLTQNTQYTFTVKSKDTSNNLSTGVSTTLTTAADTTPPVVTASPIGGTYSSVQSVTLTANESATIYYTTDGSAPTQSSTVYSSPISINAPTTLKYFAKDLAGNSSSIQTQTYAINIPGTVLASDDFNRADSTTSLGTASATGQAWTALNGTWGISNNQAYLTANLSNSIAVIDTGFANCDIEVVYSVTNVQSKVICRASAFNNYIVFNSDGTLSRVVNGSFTLLGSMSPNPGLANGDTIKITLNGDSITVKVNNGAKGSVLTVTEAFNNTVTKHGIGAANTTSRFDNFKITAV